MEGAFVAHSESERLVSSGEFSGLPAPEGKAAIVECLGELLERRERRGATRQ